MKNPPEPKGILQSLKLHQHNVTSIIETLLRTMELNPILTRESRARWRGRAFGLLFGGVAMLAVVMVFTYESATHSYWPRGGDRTALMGARLFQGLTYYQIMGWMLLAPALTATAIAAEREQGLLEALQLSPLTAGQIVRGKLYSVLTFIALLLLATQPIMAICFLIGGVSPQEFVDGFTLVLLTAWAGASLGLCVSAWSRRAAQAVGTVFGFVLLWGFGTLFAFGLAIAAPRAWPKIPAVGILAEIIGYVALLNPAFVRLLQQNWGAGAMPVGFPILPAEPEFLCRILLFGCSLLLLLSCVPAVRKPFAEQFWVEVGAATPVTEMLSSASGDGKPQDGKPQDVKPKPETANRGIYYLPFTEIIRSRNPILQRDMRAKLIFRRVGPWAFFFQSIAVLGMACAYFWLIKVAIEEPYQRQEMWTVLSGSALFGLIVAPAVVGASAITRERESGTWEGLRLSLLSPWEIIIGKQLSTVAVIGIFILLLLPFVAVCLLGEFAQPSGLAAQIVLSFLIMAATAWLAAAWGLLISYRCRKSSVATACTVGSLFIVLAMAPPFVGWALYESMSNASARVWGDFLWSLHPFGAFGAIADDYPHYASDVGYWIALRGALFIFVIGSALLANLYFNMQQAAGREE